MGKSNKVILALYGVGIIMAVVLIAWIFSSVKTSSVEISADQKIDITPEQIKSIKGVGEKRAEEIMVVIEKWMLEE